MILLVKKSIIRAINEYNKKMQNSTYLTKEKFNEFTKELEELRTVKRKEVAESLEYARSLGDLSENAEYQEARETQASIESRIMVLENTLKNATMGEEEHHVKGIVSVGSQVVIRKNNSSEDQKLMIVGSEESNAGNGKISNLSPIGLALIGKRKDEEISVNTPKGVAVFKIVSVN